MENLKFKSVLIGNRYAENFTLPDFAREDGKFSRKKTLGAIMREEYGVIDETGVKITVKVVTDKNFDNVRGYFFCGKSKHTALEFTVEKNGRRSSRICSFLRASKIPIS